nr:MerR family transcriptional regulator [uncultured Aminipila sp.]
MITVNEVSKLAGVSVRTLHYYDTIGLLYPSDTTNSGYRLYDDAALERLQQILLFRELEFSLKEIKQILDSPNFDRNKALNQQINLLRLKQEHLYGLISLALEIKNKGVNPMNFKAFNTEKLEQYAKEAKASWGHTDAYKEFEEKSKNYSSKDWSDINHMLMQNFIEFGKLLQESPESEGVQNQVKLLQDTITKNYYSCTKEILAGLGQMYSGDERFTESIDNAGGKGTAQFTSKAIAYYCEH